MVVQAGLIKESEKHLLHLENLRRKVVTSPDKLRAVSCSVFLCACLALFYVIFSTYPDLSSSTLILVQLPKKLMLYVRCGSH